MVSVSSQHCLYLWRTLVDYYLIIHIVTVVCLYNYYSAEEMEAVCVCIPLFLVTLTIFDLSVLVYILPPPRYGERGG